MLITYLAAAVALPIALYIDARLSAQNIRKARAESREDPVRLLILKDRV